MASKKSSRSNAPSTQVGCSPPASTNVEVLQGPAVVRLPDGNLVIYGTHQRYLVNQKKAARQRAKTKRELASLEPGTLDYQIAELVWRMRVE